MRNILLVDDEQQSIDVFSAALSANGNDISVAKDGKAALDLCENNKFDLILVDEMMPDMSGNELIKALRSKESTEKIPIMVVTNYSDDNLVKDAMAAGANDYILKYQLIPEDLVAKVNKLVGE